MGSIPGWTNASDGIETPLTSGRTRRTSQLSASRRRTRSIIIIITITITFIIIIITATIIIIITIVVVMFVVFRDDQKERGSPLRSHSVSGY